MKYMTPDLLAKLNADDPQDVDEADRAWQRSVARYNRHLKGIGASLPESVREFVDRDCLHDADVFGLTQPASTIFTPNDMKTYLVARQGEQLFVLGYSVAEPPALLRSTLPDRLCSSEPSWLYDEFDLAGDGAFLHEILFSTGKSLKLTFTDFTVTKFALLSLRERPSLRRGAG